MNPEPLFCDNEDEDDCDVADADVFDVVLVVSPVFAVAVAGIDVLVPVVPLVLSGNPPANAFDALKAAAPTTSDFNRWRIDCAPQKLCKLKRHNAVEL